MLWGQLSHKQHHLPSNQHSCHRQSTYGIGCSLWSLDTSAAPIKCGYLEFTNENTEERHREEAEWLGKLIDKATVNGDEVVVVLEEQTFRAKSQTTGAMFTNLKSVADAYKVECELMGYLKLVCGQKEVEFATITISDWRKSAKIRSKDRTKQLIDAEDFIRATYKIAAPGKGAESACLGYCYIKQNKLDI